CDLSAYCLLLNYLLARCRVTARCFKLDGELASLWQAGRRCVDGISPWVTRHRVERIKGERKAHARESIRGARRHGGAGRLEAGGSWWERLAAAGFDAGQPAVVASTGVTMYLTGDAIVATLRQIAALAPGSTLAMTFMLPLELVEPEDRPGYQMAEQGARAAGTPFISFFAPPEMLALAREAGFREVRHVS